MTGQLIPITQLRLICCLQPPARAIGSCGDGAGL